MNQPKLYSKHNSLQTADNIHVMENYLKLLQQNKYEKVLDIGCGEGYATAEILLPNLKSVRKIVGCDISERMISYARRKFSNAQMDFCLMDIGADGIDYRFVEEFDHVFSLFCLHWIPDQRKAFRNIFKLLKPGGEILVSFLGTNPIFDVYQNISKNNRWAPYCRTQMISPYHRMENIEENVNKMLKEIGFTTCKCFVEDRQFVFDSWSYLKKAVVAVNPILPLLSPIEQIEYLKDFAEEVKTIYGKKINLCDNEKVPVDYKLIVVYARKP